MEAIYEWMKNLIFGICALELLCQLVRSGDYRKYVRFFGGLLLMLVMIGPVFRLFSQDGVFEDALRRAFLQEEAADMELARETLAGLQSRQISEAYREELERQMREIVSAYGCRAVRLKISLEERDGSPDAVTGVDIVLARKNIGVNVFETEEGEGQQQEIQQIRAEIASLYGVPRGSISITEKE